RHARVHAGGVDAPAAVAGGVGGGGGRARGGGVAEQRDQVAVGVEAAVMGLRGGRGAEAERGGGGEAEQRGLQCGSPAITWTGGLRAQAAPESSRGPEARGCARGHARAGAIWENRVLVASPRRGDGGLPAGVDAAVAGGDRPGCRGAADRA